MLTRFDIAYYATLPVTLPYLAFRRLSKGKYQKSARGMLGGALPKRAAREVFREGSVWVHAVSVGETVAAKPMLPLLRELEPDLPILATTITETGQEHARKILKEADYVQYFPLDLSWNVRRFQECYNPKIFVMMETELWPNFLALAARRGTRVFMVNGKVSERSFGRYKMARSILKPAFDAVRAFCMQSEADAERMRILCGRDRDVHVTGNCKFDTPWQTLSPEAEEGVRAQYRLGAKRPTLVVGSTHPGEEEVILEAFRRVRKSVPDLMLVLSPRHPERFRDVVEMCQRLEGGYKVSRATHPKIDSPDIFVLDTMGELARIYGLGDVAVVAGSFCKVGGHNLLEAAAHAAPVVVGPRMHAQKEIDRLFQGTDSGCVRCTTENLGNELTVLFQDPEKRKRIGAQALHTAKSNQGSARASIEVIKKYLEG